jgi:hypothetical protein
VTSIQPRTVHVELRAASTPTPGAGP